MSTTDTTVVELAPETVEKQSFINRRIVTPIRTHKSAAIAVAAGLVLVGVAAYVGRDSQTDTSDESVEDVAEDTTVA